MKALSKIFIALLLLPLLMAILLFAVSGNWNLWLIFGWYSACLMLYLTLFLGNLFLYIKVMDIRELAEISRNLRRAWLERDEAKRKSDTLEARVRELEAQHN